VFGWGSVAVIDICQTEMTRIKEDTVIGLVFHRLLLPLAWSWWSKNTQATLISTHILIRQCAWESVGLPTSADGADQRVCWWCLMVFPPRHDPCFCFDPTVTPAFDRHQYRRVLYTCCSRTVALAAVARSATVGIILVVAMLRHARGLQPNLLHRSL